MRLDDTLVDAFEADGVVVLRGVFCDWIDTLARGVDAVLAAPSPLERSYQPTDGSAPFFQDFCNWQRIPEFRAFIHESPAGALVAALTRSQSARFFHDHILIKWPGTSTVTPWHQDAPYYCVDGTRSVSFWTPLDPVPASTALQCVAGSHRWSSVGFRPQRFDGSPLYADDDFDATPDIEAEREHLRILSWDLEPGDAVAFDFRTLHGAPANTTGTQRRVFSARFVGDEARYVKRQGPTSPPFPNVTLADGDRLDGPEFPCVYRRR